MNMALPNSRAPAADAGSERIDADELLQLLRRNMWIMLLVALALTGATAAYLSTRTPTFRAQAAMVLTNSEIRMSQIDTQLQSYELTRARVETELDVLRSRNFAEQVAKSVGLFDDPEFMSIGEGSPEKGSIERARAVVDKLLASYALHRSGESLVITVQADSTTPDLAARIANGVVDSFIALSRTRQTGVIDNSTFHLNKRIADMDKELMTRQYELADFIREYALDDSDLPGRLRREDSHLSAVLDMMIENGDRDTPEAQRLAAELADLEQRMAARTRNDLQLGRMRHSVEVLSTRHQTAVERLTDLERQRNLVQPDARQVTEAELPVSPAWPNFGSTLALTFPAGLVLAFVTALLHSAVSQLVWDGAQVSRISDLPNLGMVPHNRRRGPLLRRQEPAQFLPRFTRSPFGEALRSLVTIWSKQPNSDAESKLLMVTSGLAKEGRTTIAISMAATAAMDGMRVLLLDLDTYNHGASRSLGLPPAVTSLAQVVEGQLPLDEAVQVVENYDSFHLMAFRHGTQLTPRILHRFVTQTLPQLREAYDLIIVDTPPSLAIADAVRFGRVADEALMVVRAGKSSLRAVRSSLEKLRTGGVNVTGAVINDVSTRRYQQLNQGGKHG